MLLDIIKGVHADNDRSNLYQMLFHFIYMKIAQQAEKETYGKVIKESTVLYEIILLGRNSTVRYGHILRSRF